MSLQECTQALRTTGQLRINAGEYSASDMEAAAAVALKDNALLFIYNMKRLTCAEIGRIAQAGRNRVRFDDVYLI